MKIVFMGTPDFAIPSLQMLVENGYEVLGVVTSPDKPAGRGRKLKPSPIKSYAESQSLNVIQPEKLRNPEFIAQLEALEADLFIVVAFRMLPKVVWSIPKQGTFNLHAALLPDYRGAAPINWVLINGETQTGLTTFLIDEQIDTGNILLKTTVEIPYEWNAGDLHDHMMDVGAKLVLDTVRGFEAGELVPKQQDDSMFIHRAPKIFKEDCQINWDQPATQVYHFIRGLSPYPAARTLLGTKTFKVFQSKVGGNLESEHPGTIQIEDDRMLVACSDAWLELMEVQLEGKKRMETSAFLLGFKDFPEKAG